jgi:hypothetical protein
MIFYCVLGICHVFEAVLITFASFCKNFGSDLHMELVNSVTYMHVKINLIYCLPTLFFTFNNILPVYSGELCKTQDENLRPVIVDITVQPPVKLIMSKILNFLT